MGGPHIAGYLILHRVFHLGGYFHFLMGKEKIGKGSGAFKTGAQDIGVGVSFKLGWQSGRTVWLGLACDLGFGNVWIPDLESYTAGASMFPRFALDVVFHRSGRLNIGVTGALGALIELRPKGRITFGELTNNRYDVAASAVRFGLLLGITLGA
jgi:hypothetical protein